MWMLPPATIAGAWYAVPTSAWGIWAPSLESVSWACERPQSSAALRVCFHVPFFCAFSAFCALAFESLLAPARHDSTCNEAKQAKLRLP